MTQAAAVDPMKVFAAAARILAEEPMFAVGEADIRGNTYRVFKNAPPSLVGIFLFGTQFADKDFLIYEDERLTFAETWERACRFANALARDFKIGKGEMCRIAVMGMIDALGQRPWPGHRARRDGRHGQRR